MRVQLRIVAGSLRGRKLNCTVNPGLRPAPQMLREALFSILGHAVPGRPFYDVFAGTGAVGLEALSRGARPVVLVERDFRVAAEIENHLRAFGVAHQASIVRTDAYRWAEHWHGAEEAVNIFLGPPYPDFDNRLPDLLAVIADLQQKVAPGSVLALQSERNFDPDRLPLAEQWDQRSYGRNRLSLWVKEGGEESMTDHDRA
ncbi:MAG: RsmD family RNA methyltransferase [Planctomycetes bacterium]|nr:RsmD family RNA methyltransferase [Planctomycetota bacterium]